MGQSRGRNHLVEGANDAAGPLQTSGQIAPGPGDMIIDGQDLTAKPQQDMGVETFEPLTASWLFNERYASTQFAEGYDAEIELGAVHIR